MTTPGPLAQVAWALLTLGITGIVVFILVGMIFTHQIGLLGILGLGWAIVAAALIQRGWRRRRRLMQTRRRHSLLVLVAVLLVATPVLAQPRASFYGSVPAAPKTRIEVITIVPPPTAIPPGQALILRTRPDGTTRVTVCSWIQGVGLLCTEGR